MFDGKNKWRRYMHFALLFLIMLYIAYAAPYSHDDWRWGTATGIKRLQSHFAGYNGRYLANLLIIAITRSKLLKAMVMPILIVGIAIFVTKIAERLAEYSKVSEGRIDVSAVSCLLMLTVPMGIFRESYGWQSALANNLPPVLLILLYIYVTLPVYRGEKITHSAAWGMVLFPVGIAAQLFSEHNTLLNLAYGCWMLFLAVLHYIRSEKEGRSRSNILVTVSWFIAAAAGTAIMFSNTAYTGASNDASKFKSIALSVNLFVEAFETQVSNYWLVIPWFVMLAVGVALTRLLLHKNDARSALNKLLIAVLIFWPLAAGYMSLHVEYRILGDESKSLLIRTALACLYYLAVLIAWWRVTERGVRIAAVSLHFCQAVVALPLLAAHPIGARCFYVTYIFEALEAIIAVGILQGQYQEKACEKEKVIRAFALGGMLFMGVIYCSAFRQIHMTEQEREARIQQAIEANAADVGLPYLPYALRYTWKTVPDNESWMKNFKDFYGIPEEMNVTFYE